jgi:formylglycine-generating enzyme required for sulfatase activity
MAHDVFISFSREDKAIADAACAILEARRIRCWIAPRDVQPGIPYPQSIMEGIRGSRVLVLILSARSNTSKHVMREVERAVNCEIPVVPLRIEDVSLSGSLEYLVGSLHWLDALTPPLERHVETLARVVQAILAEFRGEETCAGPPSGKDVLTKGHLDSAPATPRADSPPSTSDPGQPPKAEAQGAESSKSKTSAKSAAVIDAEGLPRQTPVASRRQESAVSTRLVGAPPKRRNIPWLWFYVAALPLLAFLGVIIYIVTDNGTVKITGTDPNMVVRIDNKKIPIENIGEPIILRTGQHDFLVTRGELVVKTQTFQIQRGEEMALEVTYIPKPPLTKQGGDKKAASPTQKPQPPSPQPMPGWTNSIGMKFVRIEPGEFDMGSTKDQIDQLMRLLTMSPHPEWWTGEQPQHSVKITRPFLLGVHEVTQGQYQAVMGENPSRFKGSEYLPVEQVSWMDAVNFCNKVSEREGRKPYYRIEGNEVAIAGGNGYRLPTEAEWEYACRAGTPAFYGFGDDAGAVGEYAWYIETSGKTTHPVGQKWPNPWGLYDMLGNVWEWCADGYDERYYDGYHGSSVATDPPGAPRASHRVNRGGAWECFFGFCRPAFRGKCAPGDRWNFLGFRVAAVPE